MRRISASRAISVSWDTAAVLHTTRDTAHVNQLNAYFAPYFALHVLQLTLHLQEHSYLCIYLMFARSSQRNKGKPASSPQGLKNSNPGTEKALYSV
jgi:hypothetical protein